MALNVGFVGLGEMGGEMARHVATKSDGRFKVHGFDLRKQAMNAVKKHGVTPVATLKALAKVCDVFIVMVGFDHQVKQVVTDITKDGKKGAVIVITATSHPSMVHECAKIAKKKGIGVIDAPVCFGLDGARDGTLMSTCGGAKKDYEKARPVLECYSRAAPHLGELGAGEIGKTCNNMLHWAHSIANYEVILLAKAYGIDGQKMRETLMKCPGNNGTLERWDHTKFTWQEKDMDIALDLAQKRKVLLPMFGQVDQLIKMFHADDVAELLYDKKKAHYLGIEYTKKPITMD
ncbi:MAG: 3-hydroxyisobutyrate dehydrogenase-like beta-hydroxyacid dehydrogenase [Alphaproteobacteria bacterium]|jgi:3-hydroxyisobutyrate dehydrogenase-like beta-hydroxyacid dehydrogenase